MKMTKRQARANWILANIVAIKAARCAEGNNSKNAARCVGMSGGGWGYWAQAFKLAGVSCGKQDYWSGSLPTPSTAINKGIADYIRTNATADIR